MSIWIDPHKIHKPKTKASIKKKHRHSKKKTSNSTRKPKLTNKTKKLPHNHPTDINNYVLPNQHNTLHSILAKSDRKHNKIPNTYCTPSAKDYLKINIEYTTPNK